MLVTPEGIVTSFRPKHPKKVEASMIATLSGIVTEDRRLQPSKAFSPMLVTEKIITL